MSMRNTHNRGPERLANPTPIDPTINEPLRFKVVFDKGDLDADDHYAHRVADLLAIGGIEANPVTVGTWHYVRDAFDDGVPAAETALKLAGWIYNGQLPV